jgi:phosphate starvation-inducible membrane PsiE
VPLHPNFIVITALQNIVLLPFFLGLILHFFVIRGLWKGQKWSPVFLTILHGVALALSAFWMTGDTHWAIPFSILLFFLALEIECWIHPYFNPKKKFSLLGFLKLLKK